MQRFITIRLPLYPPTIWKCASSDSARFLVPPSAYMYSQDPFTDFHDQYIKWRLAQGCDFWGSRVQNITFRQLFPQTQVYGQFLTGLRKFHVKKAFKMGMLFCKLPLFVIVAPWKLYRWGGKSGSTNPNMRSSATPYVQVVKGSRDLLFKFWDSLHISGTVGARNFKFGMQGIQTKWMQNYVKGAGKGHVTYFWYFWIPSISLERLEVETSNFACRLNYGN